MGNWAAGTKRDNCREKTQGTVLCVNNQPARKEWLIISRDYETSVTYTSTTAFFSSDEKRWINRIRKLKETNPFEVRILEQPENNDGCIYAAIPSNWLKIAPPRKLSYTDEQREAMGERLKKYRASKADLQETDDDDDDEEDDDEWK